MSFKAGFIVPHPPLIIPEIGRGEESKIQATIDSYHKVAKQIAEIKPDTIIVTTPHSIIYSDYIHISPGKRAKGDFRNFRHRDVFIETEYDVDLAGQIIDKARENGIATGNLGERDKALDHGVMIPLYFVNQYYNDYKTVRISISGLSYQVHYELGKCIGKIAEESGKKIVFIASGDLSHKLKENGPYGYAEEGPIFDKQVTEIMKTGDLSHLLELDEKMCDKAAECGLRSFIIMAGTLDGKTYTSELLSYEGTFGVGYAVAAYHALEDGEDMERLKEDEYVRLARQTLENYVSKNEVIDKPKDLSKGISEQRGGVFVTLEIDGNLRGCIGTIGPTTDSIADEIIQNAISAGTRDPRFSPVSKAELNRLSYSVDVLGEPEEILSIDDLDPKKYGVIVSKGYRRGLLLPNLDGVDTADHQLSIALSKAGIHPREDYRLERFQVVRHK